MDNRERVGRVELAAAFRLAVRLGFHEGVCNRFSLALTDDGREFLVNPHGRHFAELRARELLRVDVDGRVLAGDGEVEPSALYILGWLVHAARCARFSNRGGSVLREVAVALVFWMVAGAALAAEPAHWRLEWPNTDFTKHNVEFDEIIPGGPPKDGIPSIDDPEFVPVAEAALPDNEPVIGVVVEGDARAYPLRILIWHEIVNDVAGGVPVAVTYCPLCNTGLVFDRRVGEEVLEFGTTGKLRKSDLVMYDRTTESWWQQFSGEAIVGELTGTQLNMLPARLESFAKFKERAPAGRVQVAPGDARGYGLSPYAGYDGAPAPFLYHGMLPKGIAPLVRVVRVGDQAWSLELIRRNAPFEVGDLRFTWEPGQASALDAGTIAEGKDVGNVVVQQKTAAGWEDAVYSVDFAFAFHAFFPGGVIHVRETGG